MYVLHSTHFDTRKLAICICENKSANQLGGNCAANLCLCFYYIDSTIPLIINFKFLAIFCGCTAGFVWDLVRILDDRSSRGETHIYTAQQKFSMGRSMKDYV